MNASRTNPSDRTEVNLKAAMSGDEKNDVPLRDGDILTIRQLPRWNDIGASMTIRGEVLHPGSYGIEPGERLSSVLARSGGFAAVCCLGAVVQGETSHHEYINHQVSRAIMETTVASGVPVLFGVLTCPTMELAMQRAGGTGGNKGSETALAAMEMANLLKKIPHGPSGIESGRIGSGRI